MKGFLTLIILLAVSFCIAGEEKKESEAIIAFVKKDKAVEYSIDIKEPFKMNLKAPFRFELLKGEKEVVKKVLLNDFKFNGKGHYSYTSNLEEKSLFYWFIACEHKNGEVVACKTFTGKKEIK